jgi:IS5 family transposase
MHQTRKDKQYYFGAKAHIGVDGREGIVHSVCKAVASVVGVHMLPVFRTGTRRRRGTTVVIRVREK